MKIWSDKDADLEVLAGKTAAIIGYGNQGRAQALNLRDSGQSVVIGNRDDEYRSVAISDGFSPMTISEAADAGDLVFMLTTDESQPLIWDEQIAPALRSGNILVWASGYNIAYELITPPPEVDVVMVAPRMTGNMVRELYLREKGAMAQVAVHQDASGFAHQHMLAVAKAIGCTRGGVYASSFREEAELDLFAEQVVWAGLTAWFVECFQIGTEAGFSPELMVLELYASGEASEILGLMARNGFFKQMTHHSTTSQYGTLSRGPDLITDEMKKRARRNLYEDIKGGQFADEWSRVQASSMDKLEDLRSSALNHPMSRAEDAVISLIQKAHSLE